MAGEKYIKIEKIGDIRISTYTNRSRNGSEQIFYTGNDCRDWERYRKEGGNNGVSGVIMHDKPDTIKITNKESHYYAELINGVWWWVNGCPECNGEDPDWIGTKCTEHNVCTVCSIPRAELKEIPWGVKGGFMCKPCMTNLDEIKRTENLQKVAEKEYDEWDYHHNDKVVCPHCSESYSPDEEVGNDEVECEVCGGKYEIETEVSVTYSTTVIGKRVKL